MAKTRKNRRFLVSQKQNVSATKKHAKIAVKAKPDVKKTAKKTFSIKDTLYIKSFKEMNMKLVYVTLLSLGFFGVFYLMSLLLDFIITKLGITELMLLDETAAAALYSKLVIIVVYFIVFVVLSIIVWSLIEGLVMFMLYKKKFSLKLVLKFLCMNSIMAVFFIALLVLARMMSSQITANYFILFSMLAVIYFTTLMTLFLFKDEKLWRSMGKAFCFGVGRIHKTLPPFALAFLTMYVFLLPFWYLTELVDNIAIAAVYYVAFFYALAWARSYLMRTVVEIDKR